MIKVFKVGQCDWVAAATEKEAIQCLADSCYDGKIDCEDMKYIIEDGVVELSDKEMILHKHIGEEGEPMEKGYPKTFKKELEYLILEKTNFPILFASSEI